MPRILDKEDLLKNVVDASRLDRFWLDTIHPSDNGQALVKFPESLVGYDIQVVYVPIRRSDKATPVKRPFRKTPSGLDVFDSLREQGPILDETELSVFDRVKDCGRQVALA